MATIALVVLLGGGGGAYWKFVANKPVDPKAEAAKAKEEKAKEEKAKEAAAVAVPFEPFVVNLADVGGTRFLRVTLSLVVHEEEKAKELEEGVAKMKVRSAILELLSLQHAERLITPEGKSELKKTIAEAADKAVAELHVSDVLFSEFVVQF